MGQSVFLYGNWLKGIANVQVSILGGLLLLSQVPTTWVLRGSSTYSKYYVGAKRNQSPFCNFLHQKILGFMRWCSYFVNCTNTALTRSTFQHKMQNISQPDSTWTWWRAYVLPPIPWTWPGRGGNKPEGERGKVRKEGREGRKVRNLEGRKLSRSSQVSMPMITIVPLPEEDREDAPWWTVKLRQRSQEFKMTYLV